MKKLFVPTLCTLIGCAAGAGMVTRAQTFAPPTAQQPQWEQFCDYVEHWDDGVSNERMARWGDMGFELVGVTEERTCYKRQRR